jgi:hypothetical protein
MFFTSFIAAKNIMEFLPQAMTEKELSAYYEKQKHAYIRARKAD